MTHPFLQSDSWAHFQTNLDRHVRRDHGDDWSYLAIAETGTFNRRLYTPYGPVVDTLAGFDAALQSLRVQARVDNATFIRVEPTTGVTADDLRVRGLLPVTYQQLQPAHTQIIDLSPVEDDIVAAMSQNTRNLYHNYHKKALQMHVSSDPADIELFLGFIHDVAKRNHITPHSDEYFRLQATTLFPSGAAKLFYATLDGTPIAAAIMYDSDDTRTYAHAAADDSYRKLSAGTALLAYAIVDAKRAGKQHFDLYGIAPTDDPSHPWAGFTKFKKSFGGRSVEYVGAWDLPLQPLRYRLYRLYQSIRRLIRR